VVEVPVRNWRVDPDAMADAVTAKTKLVWISNPNNPLGSVCDRKAFERLLDRLPETAWVILDEAYAEFAPPEELPDRVRLLREKRNLIVVRTFSKYYGLAGARLGYALASADVVTAIDTVSEPFNANRIGLAGAVALLRHGKAELEAARQRIFADRERLQRALEDRGCFVVPSRANFVFADTPYDGESLAKELLLRGVIVRPCSGWGFPGALRVTVGTTAETDRFLRTFDETVPALAERAGTTKNMEWNVVL
jgi:histidinol-phosphate aminotransferase